MAMAARNVFLCLFMNSPLYPAVFGEKIDGSSQEEKPKLTTGYADNLSFTVEINDDKATTKIWTEPLVRERGDFGKKERVIFRDLSSRKKETSAEFVDIFVMRPENFLGLRNRGPRDPLFVSDYGMNFYHGFLGLVREDDSEGA